MNADGLSRWYRWIEYAAFGPALERGRYAFLDRLSTARRILIFGEGDGRTLARLLALAPEANIDVVELSERMIALARRRAGTEVGRVRFHRCDALRSEWPAGEFDGVMTHFFLDCFSAPEARQLIAGIASRMTPDAVWLVTDFAIPGHGWRRWHAAILVPIMYRFFRLTTGLRTQSLPDIVGLLKEAGLTRIDAIEWRAGLIRSEIWKRTT